MTTKQPATPLPWKACSAFIDNAPNRAIVARAEWGGANVADCGAQTNETPRAMLDAAYIVHACNAYPELVAALELIRDSQGFNGGTFVSELQGIARDAITKARA